ncbi:Winged helix DNA-binding domain-containing protein [Parafrankia irregularis]|uniref:Winged helix DNA-binding domain-containing protein n=1 Tax=Parafrankia irregularis TaxID=795642 RepID=A0A0S4QSD7_9ACTN|nr:MULTISPECIES: winged helix DNA-binding domain-containing protein [Parafrankia]MBE3201646.1 AlkZ family DNA glycosylase [Parafrankia sp. CH37]CUU57386.1 Winged helix DNA-binding domain-containing protein [Parafrankia irregularis]
MPGASEIGLLRLVAQRLAGEPAATPAEAVRTLGGLQAQERGSLLMSVALRTTGRSQAGVVAAFDAGELVTSWPIRGTLHTVPAEDLGWLTALTAPRLATLAARRRAELGLDTAVFERARARAVEALSGGRRLLRDELYAAWEAAGIATGGQRGYHLIVHLAETGTLCLGPARDGQQAFVLVAEWVRQPRQLDGEEALGALALAYFRGHGPASRDDFAKWTKLLAADVRTAVAVARPSLAGLDVDGVEHLMDPLTPERLATCRDEARAVHLLPGFDELVLGYTDRSAMLGRKDFQRVVPGGNGVFRPTVVHDGRIVATWQRRRPRGRGDTIETSPFTSLSASVRAEIDRVATLLP